MKETILAYKGSDNFLACSYTGPDSDVSTKSFNSSILAKDGQLLIGVKDDPICLNAMRSGVVSEFIHGITPDKIGTSLSSITMDRSYHDTEILIITKSSDVFYITGGVIYHIEDNCFVIGPGKELVYGSLFALRSIDIPGMEKVQIAMHALKEYQPSMNSKYDIERI